MILDTATRSLQIVLGEAQVTTACDIIACYAVTTASTFATATALAVSSGVTPVTTVAAPPSGSAYQVNEVRVFNNDTVPHQITLRLLDGAVVRVIQSLQIQALGHFVYTSTSGSTYIQRFWRSS